MSSAGPAETGPGPTGPQARWARIQELFHAAADLPAGEQQPFLEQQCGADRALLAALERARQEQPVLGSFRDDPYEPAVSFSAGEYAGLMLAVRLRAAVYRDHPGYRQKWSPAGAVFPPRPGDREGEQGDGEQAREHDRGT